jgi:antitoxin ParD1/3/4
MADVAINCAAVGTGCRYGNSCHMLPWMVIQLNEFIMQTMNISLPDQLKEFVDNQVGSGRYSSVSEYVRELIRDDEKRKTQDKLEALLMEGIRSGDPTEMTRQDWDDIRREALKQFQARKSHKTA